MHFFQHWYICCFFFQVPSTKVVRWWPSWFAFFIWPIKKIQLNHHYLATTHPLPQSKKSAILSRWVCQACWCLSIQCLEIFVFLGGARVDARERTSLSCFLRVCLMAWDSACIRMRMLLIRLLACLFEVVLVMSLQVLKSLSCNSLLSDLRETNL